MAKLPMNKHFVSPQLSLFQNVLCNTDAERQKLSNSIELWDSLPRYSVSRQSMNDLRDESGYLKLLKLECSYRQTQFTVVIQPALIESKDASGKITTQAYYPSANEELIEEALRKLALDQNKGFYDQAEAISGVIFTLYQLREELKRCGHTRSYAQIKLSLDIMARSFIEIFGDMKLSKNTQRSTYFPEVISVSRKDLDADPQAKWMVRFHPLVANSIDKLSYRQFNYDQLMQHSRQLTRWLHKYLVIRYTFASPLKSFEIRFSTIRRDSAMLNGYSSEIRQIAECTECIDELKQNGMLDKIEVQREVGAKNKVMDVVYTLYPSRDFVMEVKAANRRVTMNEESVAASKATAIESR